MTRILITGASGFVGRHCVPLLARQGCAVHAVVGPGTTGLAPQKPGFLKKPGFSSSDVTVHGVDLHDVAATSRLIADVRPTHLLHLAWNATPGEFWTTTENLDWVTASLRLVRSFADQGGRRVVVAGTCAEYAPSDAPLHETRSPCRPVTLYGACKHHAHELLAMYCASRGVSLAWARLFGLFGPDEHPRRLVASTLQSLRSGLPVHCTSSQLERDVLHIDDAARALVSLLGSELTGAVNIGSGRAVTIGDIVRQLARRVQSGAAIECGSVARPHHEPPRIVADVGRLRDELGWRPVFTLSEGLAHVVSQSIPRIAARPRAA